MGEATAEDRFRQQTLRNAAAAEVRADRCDLLARRHRAEADGEADELRRAWLVSTADRYAEIAEQYRAVARKGRESVAEVRP